ncbi:MAG: hypothetical protein KDI52_07755 [Xanthomonadales bacterium]|nr:hypothetical protein [Xanthomonadales bacterium]
MKLTEKQLAEMFQKSHDSSVDESNDFLYDYAELSDTRLANVEKIADNTQLSMSYQVINQLQDWSVAVGQSVDLKLKPKFTTSILSWFKPALATAAVVTAVYFVTPELDQKSPINNSSDVIMFSASFDEQSDKIVTLSFDKSSSKQTEDTISKSSFG